MPNTLEFPIIMAPEMITSGWPDLYTSGLMKAHGSLTSSSSLKEVRVAIAEVMPAFRDWTNDCERRPAVSSGYYQGLAKPGKGVSVTPAT